MKNFVNTILILSAFVPILSSAFAQHQIVTGKNIFQQFHREISQTYEIDYFIYLPEVYETTSQEWPLVLFLHGAGERGSDINYVKRNGPPRLIEEGQQFPFILVSPQCPERTIWDDKLLITLLDEIESKYNVDKSGVYLTGLSMGGHATWSLAIQNPERFAAIIPICA